MSRNADAAVGESRQNFVYWETKIYLPFLLTKSGVFQKNNLFLIC